MKNFLEELINKIIKKNIKFAGHMSIVVLYLLFILTILICTILGTSFILYSLLGDYLFKEISTCKSCNGNILVTRIFGETIE